MSSIFEYRDDSLYFHHSIDNTPNDNNFPIHIHEQFEIYYFISGDAVYLVEGNEYKLTAGSLLIMRNAESHKVKILSDKPYERFSLHFSPNVLDCIDPDNLLLSPFINRNLGQNNLFKVSEFKNIQPIELFECMCKKFNTDKEIKLNILTFLYPLLSCINTSFNNKEKKIITSKRNIVDDLIEYINSHLFSDLSLESLSAHFFLSSSQLSRLFKKSTGTSIWEYILIKRLLSAKSKIKSGTPVTTACIECGFKDYSSFYRAYIKHFNNSPNKDKL